MLFCAEDFEKYYLTNNPRSNTYYQKYAQKYLRPGLAIQWNWTAAFFGRYWLLYRKAYRAFLGVFLCELLAFPVLLACFQGLAGNDWPNDVYYKPVSVCISSLLLGIFGNNLYFWELKTRVARRSETRGVSFLGIFVGEFVLDLVLAVVFSLVMMIVAGLFVADAAGLFSIPFLR